MKKDLFGKMKDGRLAYKYTIEGDGIKAIFTDYGATLISLIVKNTDVVLGYDTLEEYSTKSGYLGAIVGRVGNRIENSMFTLDGVAYKLSTNNGVNHLHGGTGGISRKLFTVQSANNNSITFTEKSSDGEDGYPGNLIISVTYILENGGLTISYTAKTDKKTPVSLTNHSYFNLNGEGSGSVLEHSMQIFADRITPVDENLIPRGEFMDVTGTPFDLRKPVKIGKGINEDFIQIKNCKGYDTNFCINGKGFRKAAVCTGDKTGITMEVYTDAPGMQFYSANFLDTNGKNGVLYPARSGFCMETQNFPNAVNYPEEYGFKFLEKDEIYKTKTVYKFI